MVIYERLRVGNSRLAYAISNAIPTIKNDDPPARSAKLFHANCHNDWSCASRWSSLLAASLVSGTQTELGGHTRLVLQTPRIQSNAVRLGLIGAFWSE